jgi:SpoVK/Ycf46/Vps4 family AAA+-type ATPase
MWLSRALTRLSDGSVRARDGLTSGTESAEWDDLVLPTFVRQQVRDLVAQVRERVAVRDHWGISHRHVSVPCVAAVFHGSRGTGKTLAAGVVSRALGQDLYRVDLQSVIGRYLGETERNLRRVFEIAESNGAVLFFDQADKLFSRRADAAEGPDWYTHFASMLRPMMESYPGLIIFITTREPASDNPLLPCVQFVVSFPFPAPRERAEIWRRVFSPHVRTDGIEVERLAQLEVTGGQIRNIARHAATHANALGEPVGMSHLLAAVKVEYERLGRPVTASELSGW